MGAARTGHRTALKHVLANWKMYPTVDEAVALVEVVQAGLRQRIGTSPRVIVCPPFVSLVPVRAVVEAHSMALGAQNCHWEPQGPYTGEISPRMLEGVVDYVMVGHSDRRAAGETDGQIARKVAAVAASDLVPILFVGEEGRGDNAVHETEQRLRRGLSRIDPGRSRVLVVYEPAWAIGAENAAPADHVGEVVEHLKGVLHDLSARDPTVIYGGTVNERNVDDLIQLDVLDGVGATRSSLDPLTFLGIVDRVAAAG
jgi:triosephosphate isomerase